jgi:sarcosine oxidase subunit gamma
MPPLPRALLIRGEAISTGLAELDLMLKEVLGSCSICRVQTWDSEALAPLAVTEVLGGAWPEKTGAVASGDVDIICVGPTDWLVLAADLAPTALLRLLDTLFRDSTFRATNVSQALIRVKIEGSDVRELLAKGCALDLDPQRFPPGRSSRTRFADTPVILRCIRQSTFECIVAPSYADYFLVWLEDAALEFRERPRIDGGE